MKIKENKLIEAANAGMDEFIEAIANAIKEGAGGELSPETLPKLNSDQVTLLGYLLLREELMDGGFIQLIHNGYGTFFFKNPFDTAVRQWGLVELCRLMRHAKKQYQRCHEDIEKEMDDDAFMALYEQYNMFEDFDDEFVANEEQWTGMIAYYVDEHLDRFVEVERTQ